MTIPYQFKPDRWTQNNRMGCEQADACLAHNCVIRKEVIKLGVYLTLLNDPRTMLSDYSFRYCLVRTIEQIENTHKQTLDPFT